MWSLRVAALLLACAALATAEGPRARGSLRGALRALERRRRAPAGLPLAPFRYPSYLGDVADYRPDDAPMLLDQIERSRPVSKAVILGYIDKNEDYLPPGGYTTAFRERNGELNGHHKISNQRKRSSSFRERTSSKASPETERLKQILLKTIADEEEVEADDEEEAIDDLLQKQHDRYDSDAKYANLLSSLWGEYKNKFAQSDVAESPDEKLLDLYGKKNVHKRQIPGDYNPSGWGPIAFKRKRSSNQRLDEPAVPNDFLYSLKFVSQGDPTAVENLKDEKSVDDEEDSDVSKIIRNRIQDSRHSSYNIPPQKHLDAPEEYMLALQPINNPPSPEDFSEDEADYMYENAKEKRFPVSKRSNSFSAPSSYRQRFSKRNLRNNKMYRSVGTDPRVLKELTSIFGSKDSEILKDQIISKPVKRSSVPDDNSHESKPPAVTALMSHHESNDSHEDHSHGHDGQQHAEQDHPHSRHEHDNMPPLLSSGHDHSHENEENKEIDFKDDAETHIHLEHPIILKKKSIDWSNYFGIDKRKKKSLSPDSLHDTYLENARRYMNSIPLKNFRLHEQPQTLSENDFKFESSDNKLEEKRTPKQIDQLKLDNMDNKLKNMETVIVDEALQYSESNDGLDTKEEQEIKEKILSRLAAAYSLEKMRKALKEFKLSLQAQRNAMKDVPPPEYDEDKEKRGLKEKSEKKPTPTVDEGKAANDNGIREKPDEDFESEQGAGHFLNGPETMSEGYMGGSGMKGRPSQDDGNEGGSCPILDRIMRRCQRIDILAGDHGSLFLPLCSYHQICYLCGPSSPTGCDLIFLSEADSVCGGRTACLEAARASVMSLREVHDALADDLEGECSSGSCLARAMQDNWQRPYKR